MLDDVSGIDVAHRLQHAADDPTLSPAVRVRARELAERLRRGVRIVFLGPEAVGKSTLVDAMLALPFGRDAPASQSRVFGAANAQDDAWYSATPVVFQPMKQSALGHAQIIDVACPPNGPSFERCIEEHLAIADIVVWCTQAFAPDEARLWQLAADPLKDHSFLVLTKADLLAEHGLLQDRVTALQPVVAEEFHSFFPVTTPALRKQQSAPGTVPDTAYAASGVKALRDTVASLVQSGQRADLDSALLFLERQGLTLETACAPAASAHVEPATVSASQHHTACAALREALIARAFDLAELSFDESEGDMTEVLELCGTISEDMAGDMRSLSADHTELEVWSTAFEEASDKIMLMTMENDTRSAADAVSILLQLRRDLGQLAFQ